MNYEIDAKNKSVGRLAGEIAVILQGKKNPKYNPRLEGEDSVTIKNIAKIAISSKKAKQKIYYSHNTQLGHLKEKSMEMILAKFGPAEVLRRSVMGMLPKNRLRIKRIKKLVIE